MDSWYNCRNGMERPANFGWSIGFGIEGLVLGWSSGEEEVDDVFGAAEGGIACELRPGLCCCHEVRKRETT